MLRLLRKKNRAKRKWRTRAMLIDLHKTKITLELTYRFRQKHSPPWSIEKEVQNKLDQ